MARRRFRVDTIISILRRLQRKESCRSIAKAGLAGRNKTYQIRKIAKEKGWLDRVDVFPSEEEISETLIAPVLNIPHQISLVEPYRENVEEWVSQGIGIKAIFDALKRQNPPFDGSYGSVLRFVGKIRKSRKEAFIPLSFEPGECAQVDFGSGPVLLNPFTGKRQRTHFFVMTLCFSRHMYVEMVWDQKVQTWLRCHRNAFEWFGGVTPRVIIDNLKSAVTRACRYDPAIQRSYEDFARDYGFIISPCEPGKPRHKGRVEAGVKYVKRSFLPLRDFRDSISEANRQLKQWIMEVGNRIHGTTKQMPLKMFAELDKPALLPLPESPCGYTAWSKVRVHCDSHVTYEKAYYSAPYEYVGETLWLCADDRLVKLFVEKKGRNEQVALHVIAGRAGERRTNLSHLPPHKAAWILHNPQWCKSEAEKVGSNCKKMIDLLLDAGVVDHLRAAQGILRLGGRYGSQRLDSACKRAVYYDNIRYSAIKRILRLGLDQSVPDDTPSCQNFDGRFSRDIAELLYPEKKRAKEMERSKK